jgi:hypothetical protein
MLGVRNAIAEVLDNTNLAQMSLVGDPEKLIAEQISA